MSIKFGVESFCIDNCKENICNQSSWLSCPIWAVGNGLDVEDVNYACDDYEEPYEPEDCSLERDLMVNSFSHKEGMRRYFKEMEEITNDKEIPYTGEFPWEEVNWSKYEVTYYFDDPLPF